MSSDEESIGSIHSSELHSGNERSEDEGEPSDSSDAESIEGQRMAADDEDEGWWDVFHTFYDDDQHEDLRSDFRNITRVIAQNSVLVQQFTEEDWRRMGEDLRGSRLLHTLRFGHCGVTAERIRAFFGEGPTYMNTESLAILGLGSNPLGQRGLVELLPVVKTVVPPFKLELGCVGLDGECAVMLSEALSEIHLCELSLHGNAIGDRGVQSLLPSVNSHRSLKSFSIGQNNIGREGFEAIAQFLRENETLEELNVREAKKEYVSMLIDSISSRSKLRELYMSAKGPESRAGKEMWSLVAPKVRQLICPSGFDALCNANHRLNWIGLFTGFAMQQAFDINARSQFGSSTTAIIRSKLRAFYFEGDFSVQPIVEMGVRLFPYALELVTRTELCVDEEDHERGSGKYYEVPNDNLDGCFRLVRNCHVPEVFSFQSPESKVSELEKKNAGLEAANASLKEEIERLLADNESLRAGSASMPNKRAKSNDK